jgi:hypothetical protein
MVEIEEGFLIRSGFEMTGGWRKERVEVKKWKSESVQE